MKRVLFAILLLLALPQYCFADAVLYVSPERGTYSIGQTFQIKIFADSGGALINAAEGDMSFDTSMLEVQSISTDGSILQSWSSEPAFSNEDGTVHFAGWTKNNFNGVNGLLITITFKALRNSAAIARLAAGAILAADGKESNIISSMRSGVFTIAPDEKIAAPAPDGELGAEASSDAIHSKLPAPVFADYPDRVAIGDRIIVKGNAEPNSRVDVFIAHGAEHEEKNQVLSAADGSFTFVSNDQAREGVYHVHAMLETEDGRFSIPSETIDILVAPIGMAATAVFGASILFEVLPFFALLIFGGLGAAYIYHRHQLAKMHYGQHSMFDGQ